MHSTVTGPSEERSRKALPPLGATVARGLTTFRVWAPAVRRVEVELHHPDKTAGYLELLPDDAHPGLFSRGEPGVAAGALYKYRVDGGNSYPDPCSRSQPEGVHGPSEVVEPASFAWTDGAWSGLRREGLVLYELHVGAFTPSGTFDGVVERLPYLRRLGVNAIELMPVADFAGGRNWGYDGVALYTPSRAYGGPNGLRRLVDAAHAHGLGVVLDVVYNHLGPYGNYLRAFSPYYFTDRYQTPWGEALNYDGEHARAMREYVLQSAECWLREYHLDGLRLDATHAIHDGSPVHILTELAQRGRAAVAGRDIVLIAENDRNDVALVAPPQAGGYGLDALWADDFHHAVHTLLTRESDGYYEDYEGTAGQIAQTVREVFMYQGQPSRYLRRVRGTRVTSEPASAFVFCLQNHDQVGNRALGERLNHLVGPDLYRVATALLLFAPETPLLFMGQEFAASTPFQYFTDFPEDLGRLVTEGRRGEFAGFRAFRDETLRGRIPDPQEEATFARSHLEWTETQQHVGCLRLYHDLLKLRRSDAVLSRNDRLATQTATLSERAVAVLRQTGAAWRLLLANFGDDLALPMDLPLLQRLRQKSTRVVLSTEGEGYRWPDEAVPSRTNIDMADRLNDGRVRAHTALIVAGG